ncbi:MAG: hypothetical protein V9F03_05845 [Microthrixaceae bacterium]
MAGDARAVHGARADSRSTQAAPAAQTAPAASTAPVTSAVPATAPPSVTPRSVGSDGVDFDTLAAKRILRRAMELESEALVVKPLGVSPEALTAAAEELGVDVEHIHAAIAEERLGLLTPSQRRLDSLVGPAQILVSRTIDADSATVLEVTEAWLTKTLMFHRIASGPDGITYVRRKDMLASIKRSTGSIMGAPDLSRVTSLDVRVSPEPNGRTVLVIEADLAVERILTIAAGTGVAGVGSAVSVVGAALIDQAVLPLVGVPFSFGLAGFVMFIRARTVSTVRVELNRIFELVSSGEPPGMRRSVTDVAKRIMGGRGNR